MRFSLVAILGLAAFASAQTITNSTSSATSRLSSAVSSAASSASLSPEQVCLAKCSSSDICCQARCVNVPCPTNLQANATTECAARCPQGSGSRADTDKYASCQASCVSSYFFSTGTAGAAAATAASSNSATFGVTGSSSASRTGSGSASATGASATQNAAPEVRFGVAGAGLVGLIIAGLAM